MSKNTLLWLGCGKLAERAISGLVNDQFDVSTVSRTEKYFDVHVKAHLGDIKDEIFLENVLSNTHDYIVITLTPGERSAAAYEKTYVECAAVLVRILKKIKHQPRRIIFVSSTSVYHQNKGEWVDETSATEPNSETAIALLKAEKILLNSHFSSVCLRFSGIYGGGRNYLLKQVLAGKSGGRQWSNRIHTEDCVGVIQFLLNLDRNSKAVPPIVLASDTQPVYSSDIYAWLAEKLGVFYDASDVKKTDTAQTRLNKRCDSRLLSSLGYIFKYPTYKTGYIQQLEMFKQEQQQ